MVIIPPPVHFEPDAYIPEWFLWTYLIGVAVLVVTGVVTSVYAIYVVWKSAEQELH
jgi:hypothetical protein